LRFFIEGEKYFRYIIKKSINFMKILSFFKKLFGGSVEPQCETKTSVEPEVKQAPVQEPVVVKQPEVKAEPVKTEPAKVEQKTTEKKITAKDIKSKARKKPQTEEAKKTETKPVAKPKGDKKPAAKRSKPSK
jgi:hypothetical protein